MSIEIGGMNASMQDLPPRASRASMKPISSITQHMLIAVNLISV